MKILTSWNGKRLRLVKSFPPPQALLVTSALLLGKNINHHQEEDEIINLSDLEQEISKEVDFLQDNLKSLQHQITDLEAKLAKLVEQQVESLEQLASSDLVKEKNAFYTRFIDALDGFVTGKSIDLISYFDEWESHYKEDYLEAKGICYRSYLS